MKEKLFPPVGFIPRGLPRLLNENPCRIPCPLAAGSIITNPALGPFKQAVHRVPPTPGKLKMNKKYFFITGLVLCVCFLISACGHKGNPSPPTEMVMAPATRGGDEGLTFATLTSLGKFNDNPISIRFRYDRNDG